MIYPSIDKILNVVDSKYALVYIVSNRSKEMMKTKFYQMDEADYKSDKTIGRALEEVYENLIHVNETFSIGKNEAYEMMKKNIYKASESYIRECDNNLLDCNLEWVNNKVEFRALVLKNSGYFDNLVSPIDGKDVGSCLLVRAIKNNGVLDIKIIDNCY